MPDLEEDELAVIYEAKVFRRSARETARAMMQDRSRRSTRWFARS